MFDESDFRLFQRRARDAWRSGKKAVKENENVKAAFRSLKSGKDELVERADRFGRSMAESEVAKTLTPASKTVVNGVSSAAHTVGAAAKAIDQKTGFSGRAKRMSADASAVVTEPLVRGLEKAGVTRAVSECQLQLSKTYGDTRAWIKPYFGPDSSREFLETVRAELIRINACILQVSEDEAGAWAGRFGKALSSKLAGALGSSTLFGIVATYGTASTGTAIASLSGAAANSAVLANIGALLGGGMATGGLILGGVGLLLGVSVYQMMSSTARQFESLTEIDQRILGISGTVIAAIDERLAQDLVEVSAEEAEQLKSNIFIPLFEMVANSDDICSRLDKNAFIFRQHVIRDFPEVAIKGCQHLKNREALAVEGLIGGVICGLLTNSVISDDPEDQMVLDALRRAVLSWPTHLRRAKCLPLR